MKTSKQLREDRASVNGKLQAIVNLARAEKREFTSEEDVKVDGYSNDLEGIDAKISRAEKIEAEEKRMAGIAGASVGSPKAKKQERFTFVGAINNVLTGRGRTDIEQELNSKAGEELRASGLNFTDGNSFAVPSTMLRAQSVTGDAAVKGGVLVPEDIAIVEPLEPKLTLEAMGATPLYGLKGNVSLPTSDSFSLSYVTETADVSASDVDFAGPILKPKRLAGVVEISKQLLMQGSIDVEAYIRRRLENAVNVAVLGGAVNGGGTEAPVGLFTAITTNINTVATAPTHDIIVDLETMIKSSDATEKSLGYLSDVALMGKMKTVKKDAGSGIFLYQNDNLNGHSYRSSSIVPTLDVGVSHPLIFGDWSQLFTGFWGGMSFTIDPYTKASSGMIRIIVEIFNDVAITSEKAFSINKVLTV